jgi:hypothetical protein
MNVMQERTDANLERMEANLREMTAEIKTNREEMRTKQEEMTARLEANRPLPGSETKDRRCAGAVGSQATSGVPCPTGGRQKTTAARNETETGKKVPMVTKKQQRGGQEGWTTVGK